MTTAARPVVGPPTASPAECRLTCRFLAEHGDYDDWAADTHRAYEAGIAACRTATTPVLTLSEGKGGAR